MKEIVRIDIGHSQTFFACKAIDITMWNLSTKPKVKRKPEKKNNFHIIAVRFDIASACVSCSIVWHFYVNACKNSAGPHFCKPQNFFLLFFSLISNTRSHEHIVFQLKHMKERHFNEIFAEKNKQTATTTTVNIGTTAFSGRIKYHFIIKFRSFFLNHFDDFFKNEGREENLIIHQRCDRTHWPLPPSIENIWIHKNLSGKFSEEIDESCRNAIEFARCISHRTKMERKIYKFSWIYS